jgi:D-arabinose 1-dehydrogenase-like Zn-dependent alcohol dehydrogenase
MGQKRIIGHQFGSRKDMMDLLQLATKNKIVAMTESFPLDEANQAHQRLRENRMRLRGAHSGLSDFLQDSSRPVIFPMLVR